MTDLAVRMATLSPIEQKELLDARLAAYEADPSIAESYEEFMAKVRARFA